MKFVRPDGRVLADIGQERKQKMYKKLLDLNMSFKDWLISIVDRFLEESEVK